MAKLFETYGTICPYSFCNLHIYMASVTHKKNIHSVRLPRHILPERYVLTLRPDLESFTFQGEEVVHVVVTKADKSVTLHASGLEVVTAEFIHAKHGVWTSKITYNQKAETVTLTFPKALPKGKGKLKLVFRGVLNDKLRGYYRSTYQFEGQTKHLATTQFEATDARRAFPCFDEPNIKAVFEVTLIVPNAHEAISNTLPALVREHEAGFKAVRFSPTPKMSTYLLAFISGDLEYVEKKTKNGIRVRVFTTKGKSTQAKYSLEVAVKILDFFEKYFEVKYPLPVLDLIAVPDFAAGAMENWGAVTFRELALLIDEEQSSLATKQYVATVVAHELAHQWFGNLVTMDWWTHLWLNEGFASYIEYLAVDHLHPEWNMWAQFMALDFAAGMDKDQLKNTHPIEVEVHHPNDIDEIFDDISYRKGSSVIRMLAEYLGAEDFRRGLAHYLKKHAYKNATTEDLWKAFEKVSAKPVSKLMRVWTQTPGFPLLRAERQERGVTVTQERFFVHPGAKDTAQLWPVPVRFTTGSKQVKTALLTKKLSQLEGVAPDTTLKLNAQATGFYRVAYGSHLLEKLAKGLAEGVFPVVDRWQLVNDAWTLAWAGKASTTAALELSFSLTEETDYNVLAEVLAGLLRVGSFYGREKWFVEYKARVRGFVHPLVKRLGFTAQPKESENDSLLRPLVLLVAGTYGDEDVVARALKMFTLSVKKGTASIPADLRAVVYRLVAFAGGLPELQYFKHLYKNAESQEEQTRLTRAMCAFLKPELVKKALEFSLTSAVRSQDAWRFVSYATHEPAAHPVVLRFVKDNWSWYMERYGSGGHALARIVQAFAGVFEEKVYRDVKAFFSKKPVPGAERAVQQVVEQMEASVLWHKRARAEMITFLKQGTREG